MYGSRSTVLNSRFTNGFGVHNNYFLLKKLVAELTPLLVGGVVSECFSQNKDELVIRIEQGSWAHFIRAHLSAGFSCLSFPETFHRARRNSVDIFPDCIGRSVVALRQFRNERSFSIQLSDDYQLVFKMHGNRANILLFHEAAVQSLFRKKLVADNTLSVDQLDRDLDVSEQAVRAAHNLKHHFFTFGKVIWRKLEAEAFDKQPLDAKWSRLQALLADLEQPVFRIAEVDRSVVLSLIDTGHVLEIERSAIRALNRFTQEYLQREGFQREKEAILHQLQQANQSGERYCQKTEAKLAEVKDDHHYKLWADLVMANLHAIKAGAEETVLTDFYTQQPVVVKLKPTLSGQKNAEVFYRKAKNQQIEIDRLEQALANKRREIDATTVLIDKVLKAETQQELRHLSQKPTAKGEKSAVLPYHAFSYLGFDIWVGRNAQANDVLTLKYAHKNDLWLHAKDVAGSHVIIRHQPGRAFPAEVIERAAALAAYNSKRKTETLAVVAYTLKKFVRKRKGDPDGMVVVEQEKTILVQPSL